MNRHARDARHSQATPRPPLSVHPFPRGLLRPVCSPPPYFREQAPPRGIPPNAAGLPTLLACRGRHPPGPASHHRDHLGERPRKDREEHRDEHRGHHPCRRVLRKRRPREVRHPPCCPGAASLPGPRLLLARPGALSAAGCGASRETRTEA
ncbi:hypothetical protein T484DRAFT_1934908 [Baffinella frigidus]|nr:hypothetical protein T484DRAFT_1934908 [Cryptophyta sp. CCMP2293]